MNQVFFFLDDEIIFDKIFMISSRSARIFHVKFIPLSPFT
jgi:hypothetical protein